MISFTFMSIVQKNKKDMRYWIKSQIFILQKDKLKKTQAKKKVDHL